LEEVLKARMVRFERVEERNWRRGRWGKDAKSEEALSLDK
jgi:hypothetical protein